MSAIRFLTPQNFVVIGTRTKTLGINLQGNVFVFFKMQGCDSCAQFEPIFAQLSKVDGRVTCAILDITQYREVTMWSRETSTPITAVPILILYVNGRPHAKFGGTKNIPSIQGFITKALQTTPPTSGSQTPFMPQAAHPPANLYGGYNGAAPQYGGRSRMSEIGAAPSMKGMIKGYSNGNNVEDEEDQKLLVPDTVTPYNTPWESEFKDPQ